MISLSDVSSLADPPEYEALRELEHSLAGLTELWTAAAHFEADWAMWRSGDFSSMDIGAIDIGTADAMRSIIIANTA